MAKMVLIKSKKQPKPFPVTEKAFLASYQEKGFELVGEVQTEATADEHDLDAVEDVQEVLITPTSVSDSHDLDEETEATADEIEIYASQSKTEKQNKAKK